MPSSHTTSMIPNPPPLEQQSLLQLNVLKGASNVVKNSTLLGRAALPIKEFTQVGFWECGRRDFPLHACVSGTSVCLQAPDLPLLSP